MKTNTATRIDTRVNGIDVDGLKGVVAEVGRNPDAGQVEFRVRSNWAGQTRTTTEVDSFTIGGERVERHFQIVADEPLQLLGENSAPNPQELLMAALNSCMSVGYVAGAAVRGITLKRLQIETAGNLDLRGFLGIDPAVPPGYETMRVTVSLEADASDEQLRELHESVLRTSPNVYNVSRPIAVDAKLQIRR